MADDSLSVVDSFSKVYAPSVGMYLPSGGRDDRRLACRVINRYRNVDQSIEFTDVI